LSAAVAIWALVTSNIGEIYTKAGGESS